ncbi:MAG: ABC transporter substrate-binding protein [Janthinobacterium lividum]
MNLRLSSICGVALTCTVALALMRSAVAQPPADLAWALHAEPGTLDPAKVDDQSAETVRYLTAGVLLRVNRMTQQPEAGLAEHWDVSADGRTVTLRLRSGLRFSDGSPLSAQDAVASLSRVLDPATAAPVADEFLQPRAVVVDSPGPLLVRLRLPRRLVSLAKVLDQIAIEPAGHGGTSQVTAGPFTLATYRRGEYLLLQRNTCFWKHDAAGKPLPYLSSVRLDIVPNRQMERLRFSRGQYGLMESLAPDDFEDLAHASGGARDLGASLNTEQLWFNQATGSRLPDYEKSWFTNAAFRHAVSLAIHRNDLARIAYKNHATPAYGFVSPANKTWFSAGGQAQHEDAKRAEALLLASGFHRNGAELMDATGHPVKFSILTNAGNHPRELMATLIAQDLHALGMQVTVVKLDFPALVERLMHTQDYEGALLGLSNVDPDPSTMANVWMSSSPNHQWNPSQKTPATAWEAELDQLTAAQAATADFRERKRAVDRMQAIVAEQQPFIYLVHPNQLVAVAPEWDGAKLSLLPPTVVSSIDTMHRREVKQ